MEMFGKTLVYVNLGLSFMMAAIGGAVLYYHADWTDAAATDSQPAGMLLAREDEYQKLSGFQLDKSTRKYNTARRDYALIDGADARFEPARRGQIGIDGNHARIPGEYLHRGGYDIGRAVLFCRIDLGQQVRVVADPLVARRRAASDHGSDDLSTGGRLQVHVSHPLFQHVADFRGLGAFAQPREIRLELLDSSRAQLALERRFLLHQALWN